MTTGSRIVLLSALLMSSAGFAVDAKRPDRGSTDRTCTFGQYGDITIHSAGIDDSYILVGGKKHRSYGGNGFIQADDDDQVMLSVDRFDNLYYRGKVRGTRCRATRP